MVGTVVETETVVQFATKSAVFHIEKAKGCNSYTILNETTRTCTEFDADGMIRFLAKMAQGLAG